VDAFGERFFGSRANKIESRELPPPVWTYTDDTVMARSIVQVLERCGRIDQDLLAQFFAREYMADPARGYGAMAHSILQDLARGRYWKLVASAAFGGSGSMGNGGAMRAAPIGAFYYDDIKNAVEAARLSAEVTHAHPEGKAGAEAVAAAASWIANGGEPQGLFDSILTTLPESETRNGIEMAARLGSADTRRASSELGNGSRVLSQDTVPFSLWCVIHFSYSFEEAMWETVSGLGDRDTTCAIVGGILGSRIAIPEAWLASREDLKL